MVGIDQFLRALRLPTMCSHCGRAMTTTDEMWRHLRKGVDGCTSENARIVARGPGFWAAGYRYATKSSEPPAAYVEAAREAGLWPVTFEDEDETEVVLAYGNDSLEQPELTLRDAAGDFVHAILHSPAVNASAVLPGNRVAPSPLSRFFSFGRACIPGCEKDVEFGIITNYPREHTSTLVNVSGVRGLTLNEVEVREESVIPDGSIIEFRGERIYWNIIAVE